MSYLVWELTLFSWQVEVLNPQLLWTWSLVYINSLRFRRKLEPEREMSAWGAKPPIIKDMVSSLH